MYFYYKLEYFIVGFIEFIIIMLDVYLNIKLTDSNKSCQDCMTMTRYIFHFKQKNIDMQLISMKSNWIFNKAKF